MVKRTVKDTSGDPYSRVDAMDITCGICTQDVDPNRPENFVIHNDKAFHCSCIKILHGKLGEDVGIRKL